MSLAVAVTTPGSRRTRQDAPACRTGASAWRRVCRSWHTHLAPCPSPRQRGPNAGDAKVQRPTGRVASQASPRRTRLRRVAVAAAHAMGPRRERGRDARGGVLPPPEQQPPSRTAESNTDTGTAGDGGSQRPRPQRDDLEEKLQHSKGCTAVGGGAERDSWRWEFFFNIDFLSCETRDRWLPSFKYRINN